MNEEWRTRQSLLMRAKDPADEEAWADFVKHYERFIFQLLHYMNINADDFDDLVQEILVKLWKNLDSYDREKSKFRAWLAIVVRNAVYDYFGRENRRSSAMKNTDDIVDRLYHTSENEIEVMIEKQWMAYISELAMERMKKVFSGKAVEVFEMSLSGVSVNEIAEKLDIETTTVYTLRNRVKSRYIKEVHALTKRLSE